MTRDEAEAIARKQHSQSPQVSWAIEDAIDAILEAVAAERQRCAALCRKLQVESRTRIELGYVCARAILGEGDAG